MQPLSIPATPSVLVLTALIILFSGIPFVSHASVDAPLRIRLSAPIKTLDWNSATQGSDGAVIRNLMQGLFSNDTQDDPSPLLAKSFHFSSDGLVLEIELRHDIRWADGAPLKSRNFLDSFERLLDPRLNSPNASMLFDIKGARDYFFGKIRKFSDVGIQAPRPYTLRIILNEPRADFPRILTHWSTYPIRKDHLSMTLGPYLIKSEETCVGQKHSECTLAINPKFYGQKPAFKTVIFESIQDGKEALDRYQHHQLDYLLQIEDTLLKGLPKDLPGLGIAKHHRVVALLLFNPNRISTNTSEKRKSIMAAIPLDAWFDADTQSRIRATSILPPSAGKASTLSAWVPEGSARDLPSESLTLGYPDDALSKSIAEQIQLQTKKLKIKIEAMPSNDHDAAKRYDLVFNLFGLDFDDPDQMLSAFLSQGTLDLFNINGSELLALIQSARQALNSKGGNSSERYAKAADYLQNQLAIVMPLFYRQRSFLLNPAYHFSAGSEGNPSVLFLKNK